MDNNEYKLYSANLNSQNWIYQRSNIISLYCNENIIYILNSYGSIYYKEDNDQDFVEMIYFKNNNIFIKSLCTGSISSHFAAISNKGELYTWGNNKYKQLGYDSEIEITNIPSKVEIWDSEFVIPKIKQVCVGLDFTLCLTDDGLVYSMGRGENGSLGHGNKYDMYVY